MFSSFSVVRVVLVNMVTKERKEIVVILESRALEVPVDHLVPQEDLDL